jgi:hypothetical protein
MAFEKRGVVDENTPQPNSPIDKTIKNTPSEMNKEAADKIDNDAAKRAADAVRDASTKK